MPGSDDDAPPPERSARQRPQPRETVRPLRRRAAVDPRFSDLYGTANTKGFEENYRFLRDQQAEEESARRERIKRLKCIARRNELEAAGADLEEYDLSDTERDVFGEDRLDELAALKLTAPVVVAEELQRLQRESQLYRARSTDALAKSRREGLRRNIIKREAAAVKEGTKRRAFVPKRSQLKREVLADTFERLEKKGGKGAVDSYVERKIKRR